MHTDTIDERLTLFQLMAKHAGVDITKLPDDELRAAAQRCLGCREGEACRHWLKEVEIDAPLPDYCRNADQFAEWAASLPR